VSTQFIVVQTGLKGFYRKIAQSEITSLILDIGAAEFRHIQQLGKTLDHSSKIIKVGTRSKANVAKEETPASGQGQRLTRSSSALQLASGIISVSDGSDAG